MVKKLFHMKPFKANTLNSLTLIVFGIWGAYPYILSGVGSITSLIPLFFGLLLLSLNNGMKKENKMIAHIVVLVTFLILIALIMPLKGALERADTMAFIRVGIMVLTSFFAMITFIRSFIQARKK